MAEINQWNDIKENYHKGSLLLGNGASIAVNDCFNYQSLYDKAVELGYLTTDVQAVFDKFFVNDFEHVLRRLWQAKLVNEALGIPSGEVENAYEKVRKALISTVRYTHVSYDDAREHLEHIFKFMQEFDYVISLNYDLIVYWAAQYGNRHLGNWFKDCFLNSEFRPDWRTVKAPYGKAVGSTLYFYPHGNLVLRREGFSGERKIQAGTDSNLLESILDKWERNSLAPAFVCEGTKENKRDAISSCNYFERVFFEVLPSLEDTLVIYGWSFGDQDEHIIEQVAKSSVKKIAVAIYGDDQVLCGNIEMKLEHLTLDDLVFFDAHSEGCWNNPTKDYKGEKKKQDKAIADDVQQLAGEKT
ncbi:DUF4917 family protein [uncultured Umboniibacter sp.]|uniref:DUF4917 family protein n=1 Tax=uncultured Umboniibacter sp. TaxID=1798917 RepID=UPI00261D00C6|nr:DUF4917 family protein [uncultured Umboniibacter sp.]